METVLVPRIFLRDPDRFGGITQDEYQRGRLVLRNGRVVGMEASDRDGASLIVLPALTEAHCHLDKCHTISRLDPVGGDLATALAVQRADKVRWTVDDLRTRMARGLTEAEASGCTLLRSHVDWGDTVDPPLAWDVLHDLSASGTGIKVQAAALIGIEQWADPDFADTAAQHIAKRGGVAGAFLHGHERVNEGLTHLFAAADRHGLALDFHVDESLEEMNGLEAIADTALKTSFSGPMLCGHAVSLMNQPPDTVARIADKLARAGIAVCALPTTNLYLQGRTDGTPDRRGITRLKELRAAGVRTVVGSDNVSDAFCPAGQHDPMAALHLAVLAAHLDPPLDRWLPMITTDARIALGLDPIFVDGARPRDLVQTRVQTLSDLLAGRHGLREFLE